MTIPNSNYKKAEILINFLSIISLVLMMFLYVIHYDYGYIHLQNYTIFFFTAINLFRIIFFTNNKQFFTYLIFSFTLVVLHLLFISNIDDINIFKFLRYYFFCILFFSIGFLSKDNLKLFFKCLIVTTLLTFIFGLIIFLFNPKIVSLIDYKDVHRLKFFFSEPSAIGPFSGILIIYALRNKNLLIFFLVCTVVILSYSVINFIVALCTGLYFCKKENFFQITALLTIIILYLFFFQENQIFINRLVGFYKTLPIYGNEISFKDSLISTNRRTKDFYEIFLFLKNSNSFFTGYGLNQHIFSADKDFYSFSLLHHFFLSFGVFGLMFILFFSFLIILKFRNTLYAYLFPFVIYALINSAQGLLLQGVWFLALACFFKLSDLKKITN
jgi:hypothetical protein